MSVAERRRQDVETSLGGLSLSASSHKANRQTSKSTTSSIVDSWEEDVSGSDTESDTPPNVTDYPSAPPPTPMSPTSTRARDGWDQFESPYTSTYTNGDVGSPRRPGSRPEKQTAVAGRLIAGALGVRTPKKTEEQRAYDKAMVEKEVRRREKERQTKKREEEEAEKARAAVWDA